MKVMEFLKVFKEPLVLFPIYLLKSIIFSFGMLDFWILGAICFYILIDKIILKADKCVDLYFEAKKMVITENQFRLDVNRDMSDIKNQLNLLKMAVNQPFDKIGKRL
jgi:hypothetical protein